MSDDSDADLAEAIMARSMRDKATRKVSFDELADQLSKQLEQLSGAGGGDETRKTEAGMLAQEGRALAIRFRSWEASPPSETERNETIDAITKFNRCAMDLLGASSDRS